MAEVSKRTCVASAATALLLVVLASVHFAVMNNGVTYEEVSIPNGDHDVPGTLVLPEAYTDGVQLPGILWAHGFTASREWYTTHTRALAQAGFAVLSIETPGHGANTADLVRQEDETDTSVSLNGLDAVAALEYLVTRPEVDPTQLGGAGHSMGGSTMIALNKAFLNGFTNLQLSATVVVGNTIDCENRPGFNSTFPRNIQDLTGKIDELIDPDELLEDMACLLDGVDKMEDGTLYGDIALGTARQVKLMSSDHVFEAVDGAIANEMIIWFSATMPSPLAASEIDLEAGDGALARELLSAIVGLLWLGLMFVHFALAPRAEDVSTALLAGPGGDKAEDEELAVGALNTRFWWAKHNAVLFAGIVLGFALDAFISSQLCTSFGVTFFIWLLSIPVFFGWWLKRATVPGFVTRTFRKDVSSVLDPRLEAGTEYTKVEKLQAYLSSPGGTKVVFLLWVIVLQVVLFNVPYSYGFGTPLFKSLDGGNARRFVLFIFLWVLLFPGWYLETVMVERRISSAFTARNVGQLVLARIFIPLLVLALVALTVFALQARVLGPLSLFVLVLYPVAGSFAVLSVLTQFARSKGHPPFTIAIVVSGVLAMGFASLLPFENC